MNNTWSALYLLSMLISIAALLAWPYEKTDDNLVKITCISIIWAAIMVAIAIF